MPHFFVEFRFHGYPKRYLRGLIKEVAEKYGVKGAVKYRPVPHMTLYGPSQTAEFESIFSKIEKVAKKYTLISFSVCNFDHKGGEDGKVIAALISASPELRNLHRELAEELSQISAPKPWDNQDDYWFHTTIAFKDINQKFDLIWNYLNEKEKPQVNQYLVRITVLNQNRRIEREYDLILKRWLNRREALSERLYRRTVNKLRELLGEPAEPKVSLWHRIVEYARHISGKKCVYLIGDTHFDHGNIIKYCERPFQSAEEMNKALVTKWNTLVAPRDTVYFLGDWSFGRGSRPPKYWIRKLKGHIVSIRGDHDDRLQGIRFANYKMLHYGGYSFLLIHDPGQRPEDWRGWIIHGHKHNNDLRYYPFINGERKSINVAVELIEYQPLSIDKLLSLNIGSIRRMETINSQPERW
ncbi:hypothetical protein ES703_20288 [subsurface metagenome]